jgi:hypothetical protein
MRCLATLLCLFLLVSCSREQLIQKISSPEDQAAARAYIDELRAHQFDEIEKAADPSIKSSTIHATLLRMSQMIPAGEPTSVNVVGARSFYGSGATTINTTFEFNFDGKLLLINVAVKTKDGVKSIVGFNVNPERQSVAEQTRFSLAGKSPIQYVVLGVMIAALLCSIYALILCVGTELPGKKWPWILFILFGIGQVTVNWTTGEWVTKFAWLQLFSAGVLKDASGPWMVSASVPLGALVFLSYRKMLLR